MITRGKRQNLFNGNRSSNADIIKKNEKENLSKHKRSIDLTSDGSGDEKIQSEKEPSQSSVFFPISTESSSSALGFGLLSQANSTLALDSCLKTLDSENFLEVGKSLVVKFVSSINCSIEVSRNYHETMNKNLEMFKNRIKIFEENIPNVKSADELLNVSTQVQSVIVNLSKTYSEVFKIHYESQLKASAALVETTQNYAAAANQVIESLSKMEKAIQEKNQKWIETLQNVEKNILRSLEAIREKEKIFNEEIGANKDKEEPSVGKKSEPKTTKRHKSK